CDICHQPDYLNGLDDTCSRCASIQSNQLIKKAHSGLKNVEIVLSTVVLSVWVISWSVQYYFNMPNVKNNTGSTLNFVEALLTTGGLFAIFCFFIGNLLWVFAFKHLQIVKLKNIQISLGATILTLVVGIFSGIIFAIINISSATCI